MGPSEPILLEFARVLDACDPSTILQSEVPQPERQQHTMVTAGRHCSRVSKAFSLEARWKIGGACSSARQTLPFQLPPKFLKDLLSPRMPILSPRRPCSDAYRTLPTTSPPPTAPQQNEDSFQRDASAYFREKLGGPPSRRLQRLVGVARVFVKATALSQEIYQDLWSGESPVFRSDRGTRFRRLYDGRRSLEQKARKTRCARRISPLYFYHDFEDRVASISQPLKAGQVKTCAVYRQLVSELGAEEASLKYDKKSGDNYTLLLNEAGLAARRIMARGKTREVRSREYSIQLIRYIYPEPQTIQAAPTTYCCSFPQYWLHLPKGL